MSTISCLSTVTVTAPSVWVEVVSVVWVVSEEGLTLTGRLPSVYTFAEGVLVLDVSGLFLKMGVYTSVRAAHILLWQKPKYLSLWFNVAIALEYTLFSLQVRHES